MKKLETKEFSLTICNKLLIKIQNPNDASERLEIY